MPKPGKKEPERIRNILGSVLDKASGSREHRPESVAAVAAWPSLVGPRLAAVTRAVSLEDGRLIVEASAPAWKQELLLVKHKLLKALNERMGASLAGDMVINVRDYPK
ncbi:DUF721 domain-containing protein [bacterium]|nr:DUF721 domain-containing protein [bacterium]